MLSITRKRSYRKMFIVLTVLVVAVAAVACFMNTPKFGRSPRGERLERVKRSPNYRDGAFRNEFPTPQITSDRSRARVMFDFLFEKRERNRPDIVLPSVKTDLKGLKREDDLLVWFGHSSYFIQQEGRRLLVDPVFEDAAPVSFLNKPFRGTGIYKAADMPEVDYLIITHDHWDHLDYSTVKDLRERTGKVVCPLGVGEYFEQWGYDKGAIVELDWNEQVKFDDGFTIHCLPSRHFSGRTLKPNRTLWASFMVESPQRHIFIGGDGGYDNRFERIARRFPVIDVAIMENGQYNEDWKYIHLMPGDLVSAIRDLNPKKIFAGHNSKYALAKHAWDEPLNNIAAAAGKEPMNLVMPVIGEVVSLNDTTGPVNRWWTGNTD